MSDHKNTVSPAIQATRFVNAILKNFNEDLDDADKYLDELAADAAEFAKVKQQLRIQGRVSIAEAKAHMQLRRTRQNAQQQQVPATPEMRDQGSDAGLHNKKDEEDGLNKDDDGTASAASDAASASADDDGEELKRPAAKSITATRSHRARGSLVPDQPAAALASSQRIASLNDATSARPTRDVADSGDADEPEDDASMQSAAMSDIYFTANRVLYPHAMHAAAGKPLLGPHETCGRALEGVLRTTSEDDPERPLTAAELAVNALHNTLNSPFEITDHVDRPRRMALNQRDDAGSLESLVDIAPRLNALIFHWASARSHILQKDLGKHWKEVSHMLPILREMLVSFSFIAPAVYNMPDGDERELAAKGLEHLMRGIARAQGDFLSPLYNERGITPQLRRELEASPTLASAPIIGKLRNTQERLVSHLAQRADTQLPLAALVQRKTDELNNVVRTAPASPTQMTPKPAGSGNKPNKPYTRQQTKNPAANANKNSQSPNAQAKDDTSRAKPQPKRGQQAAQANAGNNAGQDAPPRT